MMVRTPRATAGHGHAAKTWAHQGSVTQSTNTFTPVRRALESDKARYDSRDFKVFLQGS